MFDRRCNNSDDDARRELGAGCRQSGMTQASIWSVRVPRPTPCIHEVNETVVFYLVRYPGIE
jgi:hypothetical protein